MQFTLKFTIITTELENFYILLNMIVSMDVIFELKLSHKTV